MRVPSLSDPRRTFFALLLVMAATVGTPWVSPAIAVPEVNSTRDAQRLGGRLPNIIEEVPKHLAIQNTRQKEYLRFSTTHWNFGDGPLQIRGGGQVAPCNVNGVAFDQCTHATQEILNADGEIVATHDAGVAVFHEAHNHWHQNDVANFAVRSSLDGAPVGGAVLKTTFCLIDFDKSDSVQQNSTRVYWECNGDLQGISVGWGDEYHHSTEGQELDITGLPAGDYYLTMDADPDQNWLETNDSDNRSWAKFRLSRTGANPEVTVLESSGYEGNTSNK